MFDLDFGGMCLVRGLWGSLIVMGLNQCFGGHAFFRPSMPRGHMRCGLRPRDIVAVVSVVLLLLRVIYLWDIQGTVGYFYYDLRQ